MLGSSETSGDVTTRRDAAATDLQRHAEERRVAERAVGGEVLLDDPREGADVVEDQRLPAREHAAAQALVELDPLALHRLAGGAGESGEHQLVALAQSEAG